MKEFSEEELKRLCEKYHCSYYLTTNQAIIKTVCANWMFDYTEPPYKLYHRPVILQYHATSIQINDGYHDQKRQFDDIAELMDYIYTHDKDYFIKPKYKQPKKKKR